MVLVFKSSKVVANDRPTVEARVFQQLTVVGVDGIRLWPTGGYDRLKCIELYIETE